MQNPQLVLLAVMIGVSLELFPEPSPQYPGVPLAALGAQVAHQPCLPIPGSKQEANFIFRRRFKMSTCKISQLLFNHFPVAPLAQVPAFWIFDDDRSSKASKSLLMIFRSIKQGLGQFA